MAFLVPFQPTPADYPNRLATPQPQRLNLPPAPWLLVGLVLLCLAPRVGMALRIPSVCPDGVLYIQAAKALEAGNFREAFREMSLNIYPAILMLLHRTGMDWEFGAALWGVVISSLVVLPLWGWLRRQFDDRVALAACLLYAVQPKFIEWSPEVMRDQTFWFLFMLSIYWLWRAVVEVHLGYFIAAGAGVTLASLTRTEGLFLLIPFALWVFWRLPALQIGRGKLLLGATLCVVVFPVLLALVNFAWLYGHTGWTSLRLAPLARVEPWLHSLLGRGAATADSGDTLDAAVPLTFGRMLWVFFPTATRGLSPVFALLMFGGLWGWRRVWARRDHQPLFYTTLLILCGIWVQLWFDKNICPRYMLPVVLMASPFAALGLLALIARLLRIAGWLGRNKNSPRPPTNLRSVPGEGQGVSRNKNSPLPLGEGQGVSRNKNSPLPLGEGQGVRARAIVLAALAAVLVAGLADAMTSNAKYFETRRMASDVGRWVRRELPAPLMLVGPVGITPIANYYACNGPCQFFRWEADDDAILSMVRQSKADVVLLRPTKQLTPQRCDALVEQFRPDGLAPVARSALPPTCGDMRVLLRNSQSPHLARTPSQVY